MRNRLFFATLVAAALALGLPVQAQAPRTHWVGTWNTAMSWRPPVAGQVPTTPPVVPQTPNAPPPPPAGQPTPQVLQFSNQTIRNIVRTTIGGNRARVVLSNAFGTLPMTIGAATIARRGNDAAILPETSRPLRFSGQPSVTIPAGAQVLSDAVDLTIEPLTDLAVDIFLPGDTAAWSSPLTVHSAAGATNYVSASGNHAGETSWTPITTTSAWFVLSRVDVAAADNGAAIVAIGDSITDGTRSTLNANARWPDVLARRLQANAATRHLSVVNSGIAGNRLISEYTPNFGINLLARLDRDLLSLPNVRYAVVLEGINDIGMRGQTVGPTAADLIGAHAQIVARAHDRGLRIFGATLTPFEGAAYFTAEGETKRQAVNDWIRTSAVYDGVIDFDRATRDPEHPARLLPAYDSGDHLHPSDAGYKAMGEAVDIGLFR